MRSGEADIHDVNLIMRQTGPNISQEIARKKLPEHKTALYLIVASGISFSRDQMVLPLSRQVLVPFNYRKGVVLKENIL